MTRRIWLALMTMMFAMTVSAATVNANTLLVFGDSLSAGYGLKPGEEWAALLQQRLQAQNKEIRVVNASISGETTAGGLARLGSVLDSTKPRWVLLELGANDGLRGYPIKSLRNNLDAMIAQIEQAGASVMLVGMYIPPNYGKTYTEAFARQFAEIAAAKKLPFVPFLLEPVILNDELMQQDGLHPRAAAQPLILDLLWPQIQLLLNGNTVSRREP